ncbi:MAG: c-type cytochrome [Anaerolineae bacterium]
MISNDEASPGLDREASYLRLPSIPKPLWIVLIPLSLILVAAGAALADSNSDGAQLYQQWCSTCHGDRGQGLTDEWRATWPEGEQYCWQSKCHASNHPPDGFSFPKEVPAVIGPDTLTKFDTAGQLYAYTRSAMPYWAPNMLSDQEYRAIVTFLVEANYSENGIPLEAAPQDLSAAPLHPAVRPALAAPFFSTLTGSVSIVVVLALALGLAGWLGRRARRPSAST